MLITAKPEASMALPMSSREIAELTGKDHKKAIREIRLMLDELAGDGSDLSHVLEDKDVCGCRPAHHALVRARCRRLAPGRNAGGQRAEGAKKKAARCNNTLAAIKKINIHKNMNATNSIANRARPESAKTAFGANPRTAISPAPLPESQLHAKAKGTEGTRSTAFIHAGSRVPSADFSEGTEDTKRCYGQCKRRTTKAQFGSNEAKFLGRPGYPAAKGCAKVFASPNCGAGAENTVSEPEVYPATLSAVFLRPKFMVLDVGVLPTRKDGSMAGSMFSPPSRPSRVPEKRTEWFFQSRPGAKTMTKVNTHPTPKKGTPSPLTRQHAIESALSDALHLVRTTDTQHGVQTATGRAIRAASLLKQACSEATTSGRA